MFKTCSVEQILQNLQNLPGILQIVFGSALCALEGKNPEIGEQSIIKLLDVLDNSFEIPARSPNTEAMLPAEHVYAIKGILNYRRASLRLAHTEL